MIRKILVFLIFAVAAGCSPAVRQIDMYSAIPADTAVRVGTLPNGMRYYIRHNDRPKGQANFYIYHNVGALEESDAQNGMAHFLEHMAFNGTENLPGKTIIDYLETIGVKFGNDLNASTNRESTSYMITNVPMLREGILDTALLILHDWSHFITVDDAEVEKERGVIIEEMRGRINAGQRAGEASWPLIYNNSLHARRNIIGTEQALRTFEPETLRDFYRTWYRPDLQALIVVGDIDVDDVERRIVDMMADIPAAENPRPKEPVPIPDSEEAVAGVFTDPELTVSQISFYIRREPVPAENSGKPIAVKTALEDRLISAMLNSRLNELGLKPDAPFLSASASNGSFTRTSDVFSVTATARPGEVAQAFEAVYAEVEKVRTFKFNPGEFDRAKVQLLRAQERAYDSRNDRRNGDFANSYINNFVDNSAMASAETAFQLNTDLLNAITLEEVNARIPEIMPYRNEVALAFGPEIEGSSLPAPEELTDIITSVQSQVLEPYPDIVVTEPLISGRLRRGKVASEGPGQFGSTVWTLDNGIRVVLLPTDYRADQFYMNMSSLGGMSMVDDEDYTSAQALASLVAMSGVGDFTASDLRKQLAGKIATLNIELAGYSNGFSTGGSSKDMETIFQLCHLFLTSPRFDRADFERLMDRMRARNAHADSDPETILSDTVQNFLYPGSFRHTPFRHRMDKIDFDRMPALYDKFFGNPETFVFVIVGDFDLEEIKPMVEKYVGSLRGEPEKNTWVDRGARLKRGRADKFFTAPMETPKSTVINVYSGDIETNMHNRLAMDLFKRILDIRYTESIREEKGGTYGVRTVARINDLPEPSYTLEVQFTTDPEMADELMAIVNDEIKKIADEGPSPEDLAKVKEYLAKSRPEGLRNNATWMRFLLAYYVSGIDGFTDYDRAIEEVDGQTIGALAAKILADGNLIRIVMSPE